MKELKPPILSGAMKLMEPLRSMMTMISVSPCFGMVMIPFLFVVGDVDEKLTATLSQSV